MGTSQPAAGSAPGLYIHAPFCVSRCPYCDFYSTTDPARISAWVAGVLREADRQSGCWQTFDTLYLGGGTPSLLPAAELGALIDGLRHRLPVAAHVQATLEVNPDDVTPRRAAAWRALGFDGISVGVQSLDDRMLRFLGRRHDAATALRAVEQLQAAGFVEPGLDLIFGLPGMDADLWEDSLDRAVELGPGHLSCYELTVETGTALGRRVARGEVAGPDEETVSRLFLRTHERLTAAGFDHYEVSNYARDPAHRSRHNGKYWRHVPYLGLGPAAHSFDGLHRWWNPRSLSRWETALADDRDPAEGRERLTGDQLRLESLMLGMRTVDGVPVDTPGVRAGALATVKAEGLVTVVADRIRPTARGMLLADGLPLALTKRRGRDSS
jgi:oxygen-independent coproporphyrinogen III oxidase